jgi:PAS domain S-box-containing protein
VGGGESESHPNYLEHFRKSKKTSSTIGKQRVLFSRRKDGTEFPCIVGIKQMPESEDLIGYIRDTTGLNADHTNDAKILDPVQRLMDDTSFDAILATSKDGEIIACNMTALSEFGYDQKEDLIGQNISTLVGGPHAAKHGKYMERFQKKHKSESMLGKQRVLRSRRKDETEFECLIRINTIEDTDGLLVGYIRNIDGASRKQRRRHADEMSAQSRGSSAAKDDLIDESFDAIIVADEVGEIQRVNMTALDMFRYDSKGELVGQNLSLLVGGGMADKHDMFMKRFAETGKSESTIGQQRVLKALRKDGTEFKCIIGIKKMRNSNLLVGYVRDVSELDSLSNPIKITNLNILDPVERLVDDESFDAIIIIDYSGIMKRVNATAVKEFGYSSKDELEGQNVSILVGGGMADKHDNFVKRFRESGASSSTIGKQRVLHSKRKDGTEFPSILGIRQIPDTEYLVGHLKNMTGLSNDDRQKSMKNLDVLKHMDDTSFDSIIVIAMDGSIVQVNATAVCDFGYASKDEMTLLNISALVGGGEAKNHDKYLQKFEESGRQGTTIGKRRSLLAKRKDGTEFSCVIGIKKLPGSDHLIGYLSDTSDV